MSYYTPDAWVIAHIQFNDASIHRILAGWYGGFAGSDSWKLSSGVEKIISKDGGYDITNASGSVYSCYASAERMTSLSHAMFASFQKQVEESGGTMTIVPIEEILEQYKETE